MSKKCEKPKNLKKCQKTQQKKITFFPKNLKMPKKIRRKKCHSLSFPILGVRDLTRALQSSPFQNPGGGGPLSMTHQQE